MHPVHFGLYRMFSPGVVATCCPPCRLTPCYYVAPPLGALAWVPAGEGAKGVGVEGIRDLGRILLLSARGRLSAACEIETNDGNGLGTFVRVWALRGRCDRGTGRGPGERGIEKAGMRPTWGRRRILFANGKKREQLAFHAQDDVNGSLR